MNLFSVPETLPKDELTEILAQGASVRVERILSSGQASPEGFWYDQEEHEWVCVLQGNASLLLEGEPAPRRLEAGDTLLLPARTRHRVESTSAQPPCIWLCVFYQ